MKDKVVFTFGRFNPPTVGHQKLVDKVKLEAGKRGAEPQVYLSHSQDKKKNPLDYNTKVRLAQSAFGPAVKKTGLKTFIDILKMLSKRGVKEVVMVVGSDRVKEFDQILSKYNGGKDFTFDSIRAISAGERDPDADGVEGMSASKMRALAVASDFDKFKQGAPSSLTNSEVKKMYNDIRKMMGINEEIGEANLEFTDEELDLFVDVSYDSIMVDDEEELDEALNMQQRLKRARIMRRNMPKIKRRREMLKKKLASTDKLKTRSRKAAIKLLRKRYAGKLGANYANLAPSQKAQVDKMVERKASMLGGLSTRLLPKIRKAELERFKNARTTQKEDLDQRFEDYVNELNESQLDVVRNAISREKMSDRIKWDRMRDRARLADTRKRNRQTRVSEEEGGAGEWGTDKPVKKFVKDTPYMSIKKLLRKENDQVCL